MAWSKNVYFPTATADEWLAADPIIPLGATIFVSEKVNGTISEVRMKLGTGAEYTGTPFIDGAILDTKLDHPNGSADHVIFADGSTGVLDTLTIEELTENYHLLTPEEWVVLERFTTPSPTFDASPGFSLADLKIGSSLSGTYSFTLSKTNPDYIKPTTGGHIAVNGSWSNTGDFGLKADNTVAVVGSNSGYTNPTTVTFTLKGIDVYDQEFDIQSYSIQIKNLIIAGVYASESIADQAVLSDYQEVVTNDFDGVELILDPGGAQMYYHILVPTDSADGLDIRLLANPSYDSGNFTLYETINLDIGSITKTFNHYVSTYTSAGVSSFLLKVT